MFDLDCSKRIVLACFVTSSLASITELIATLDFRYKVCYAKIVIIVSSLSFSTRGTPEGYSNACPRRKAFAKF